MQLKWEHFCEGLRLSTPSSISAIFVRPSCAVTVIIPWLTSNRPDTYGFPVGVLEADFFIHADFDAFVLLFPFVVAFNEMILANTGPQSTQW